MASKRNRTFWNAISDSYQASHRDALDGERALAWGVWRVPESELNVLGPIEGRRILELGCGAAQWTHALITKGAHAVGVDSSDQQLAHARQLSGDAALVLGDAESLPFRDDSFDIVFCDHGATVFAVPGATVQEASRVLKSGGLFTFCMSTPVRDVCLNPSTGEVTSHLITDYFTLSTLDDGESVAYQLPYGAWIRLFRQHGLLVEDLVEIQPPEDAATTYADFVPGEWARKWPAEHIWKLRKAR
jgi:SAM-dependent methyltransferase